MNEIKPQTAGVRRKMKLGLNGFRKNTVLIYMSLKVLNKSLSVLPRKKLLQKILVYIGVTK